MKPIKLIIASACLFASASTLSSCAVWIQGRKKSVSIHSAQKGTEIYVDGKKEGIAPLMVSMRRKRDHTVIGRRGDCESDPVFIKKHFQPGWVALWLFLNPFALITDLPSGASNTFDKDDITIEMNCK